MSAFYNDDAEKSIIQAFLTRPEQQKHIAALSAGDFYRLPNQKVMSVIQTMYMEHQQIDLTTVSASIGQQYPLEAKSISDYLVSVVTDFAYSDAWAISSHIEIIKACAIRRRFYEILRQAESDLKDDSNETVSVLDKTRQSLRDIIITRHVWQSMSDVLMETFTTLEKRSKGEIPSMPSGLADFEKLTSGFHRGEFTIIGARPSVGKSAFGAFIALSTARNGYKVGILSREMSAVQYGTRIIATGTDVDSGKYRTGKLDPEDWQRVAETMALYNNLNISFMFTTRYIEDLRMEVQRKVDAGELDMLVVDYVQLMQSNQRFDKDYLRIAYVSKMLKDMTVDFNISIIGLAQVGRNADKTMPTLAELRGSGDLEQDADNVVFLHRPSDETDKYVNPEDKNLFHTLKASNRQYLAINIAKQRQGEIGTVNVVFDPSRMRFTNIDRQRNYQKQEDYEDDHGD